MGADKELYKLELLSLVSRVSQELFNHTKLQDKNLAEFVIAVSHVLPLGFSTHTAPPNSFTATRAVEGL